MEEGNRRELPPNLPWNVIVGTEADYDDPYFTANPMMFENPPTPSDLYNDDENNNNGGDGRRYITEAEEGYEIQIFVRQPNGVRVLADDDTDIPFDIRDAGVVSFDFEFSPMTNDPEVMVAVLMKAFTMEQLSKIREYFALPYQAKVVIKFGTHNTTEDGHTEWYGIKAEGVPAYLDMQQWMGDMRRKLSEIIKEFIDHTIFDYEKGDEKIFDRCSLLFFWQEPVLPPSFARMPGNPMSIQNLIIGCNKKKTKEEGRIDNMLIWSPYTKSEDGTCMIRCVVKALRRYACQVNDQERRKENKRKHGIPDVPLARGDRVEYDEKLQFNAIIKNFVRIVNVMKGRQVTFPLALRDTALVAEHFGCRIELYEWKGISAEYPEGLETLGNYGDPTQQVVTLLIHENHASWLYNENLMTDLKTCPNCLAKYKFTHENCNQSHIKWINQRHKLKYERVEAPERFIKYLHNENLVIFDMEAFRDEKGEHTPYTVGWLYYEREGKFKNLKNKATGMVPGEWVYVDAWGPGCVDDFIEWIIAFSTCDKTVEPRKITLAGFNNAAYDNLLFVSEALNKSFKMEFQISNNCVLGCKSPWWKFWDLKRFFPVGSLASICKDFKAPPEWCKTNFPHKFVTGWDMLHYEGVEPGAEYHYHPPPANWVFEPVWNLEKKCREYQKLDVLATKFIFDQLQQVCFTKLGVDSSHFITISHLTYDVWCNLVSNAKVEEGRYNPLKEHKDVYDIQIPDAELEQKIRFCIYGGKTFGTARYYVSDQLFNDEITKALETPEGKAEIYSKVADYLEFLDVNSLYASVMGVVFDRPGYENLGLYPVGPSHDCSINELRAIQAQLEAKQYNDIPLGIFHIDYIPNKKLNIPYLPRKVYRKRRDGKIVGEGLKWDCKDSTGWYTIVDIIEAHKLGYKIKIFQGTVWEGKARVFLKYIKLALAIKLEGDQTGNEALRSLGKLMCNALYGKMLQKSILESVELIQTVDEMQNFISDKKITEIILLGDKLKRILVKGETLLPETKIKKPSQMGAFILSYSRMLMESFMKVMNPLRGIEETPAEWVYTDTDSNLIKAKTEAVQRLIDAGLVKNEPGSLWYDFKDKRSKVIECIILGPKTYALKLLEKNGAINYKLKAKGFPAALLKWEDYQTLLINGVSYEKDKQPVSQIRKVISSKNEQTPFTIISRTIDKVRSLIVSNCQCLMKKLWAGRDFFDSETSYPKFYGDNHQDEELNDLDFDEMDTITVTDPETNQVWVKGGSVQETDSLPRHETTSQEVEFEEYDPYNEFELTDFY